MARTKLEIQYLGSSSQFVLDLKLGEKQHIRHTFSPSEKFDISDICSPDELNRNARFHQLKSAGTIIDVVTPGDDVVEAHLTAAELAAPSLEGLSAVSVIHQSFAAGGGGSPDDVIIYNANSPFAFRILDIQVVVATAVGASTLQLRGATGGAGATYSDAFDSSATGRARDAGAGGDDATDLIAKNGTVVLRRSDNGVAGEVLIFVRRE